MGRPKGSKNKKTLEVEEKQKQVQKQEPKPEVKTEPKPSKKEEKLEYRGVSNREEAPKIPQCMVDGGMLYRWLNDVRKTYLEEKVDKTAIKVINEVMDYIIRMEKH